MTLRTIDTTPINEAPARPTELAGDVVGSGANKRDCYALELEHASLILLTEAETALGQLTAGRRMSSAELDKLLAD
jgi:hypothetical protein